MTTVKARPMHGLFALARRLWQEALDWVYPPQCAHCGRVDVVWCAHCQRALIEMPITPLTRHVPPLSQLVASAWHEGVLQSAIHAFKYYNQRDLAQPLAARLVTALAAQHTTFDTVISVPLHAHRQAKRGYNQANLLAHALAEQVGCSLASESLVRTRDTRSQVGLDARARQANVQDAFHADAASVASKRILLVDDVCTTGSTLAACAQALYAAGAQQVCAAVLTFAKN